MCNPKKAYPNFCISTQRLCVLCFIKTYTIILHLKLCPALQSVQVSLLGGTRQQVTSRSLYMYLAVRHTLFLVLDFTHNVL